MRNAAAAVATEEEEEDDEEMTTHFSVEYIFSSAKFGKVRQTPNNLCGHYVYAIAIKWVADDGRRHTENGQIFTIKTYTDEWINRCGDCKRQRHPKLRRLISDTLPACTRHIHHTTVWRSINWCKSHTVHPTNEWTKKLKFKSDRRSHDQHHHFHIIIMHTMMALFELCEHFHLVDRGVKRYKVELIIYLMRDFVFSVNWLWDVEGVRQTLFVVCSIVTTIAWAT